VAAQITPSHGDLAIDYLRFTIDYCSNSSFGYAQDGVCLHSAEKGTPSHGDFFKICPLFWIAVRIIRKEVNKVKGKRKNEIQSRRTQYETIQFSPHLCH